GIRDSSVTGVQTCALPIFGLRLSFGRQAAVSLRDVKREPFLGSDPIGVRSRRYYRGLFGGRDGPRERDGCVSGSVTNRAGVQPRDRKSVVEGTWVELSGR